MRHPATFSYAAALIMGGTNCLAAQWPAGGLAEFADAARVLLEPRLAYTVALSVPPNMATASTAASHADFNHVYTELSRLIEEMAGRLDRTSVVC